MDDKVLVRYGIKTSPLKNSAPFPSDPSVEDAMLYDEDLLLQLQSEAMMDYESESRSSSTW